MLVFQSLSIQTGTNGTVGHGLSKPRVCYKYERWWSTHYTFAGINGRARYFEMSSNANYSEGSSFGGTNQVQQLLVFQVQMQLRIHIIFIVGMEFKVFLSLETTTALVMLTGLL